MVAVLIAGLPRSGTSWTGRVVGRAEGATFVHEPDGDYEAFSIRAKRGFGRHIVLNVEDEARDYNRLWAGAFSGGERVPNTRARIAKRLFDTATMRQRTAARLGEPVPMRLRAALALASPMGAITGTEHVVVKSVHCALSIEWIVARYSPTVLIVERDPRNVMASWMKLGMGGDRFENEFLSAASIERFGVAPPRADAPKIVQRSYIFGVLASGLREAAQRHPDWVVASHDQLCVDPEPRFAALLGQLGLVYGEDASSYINESDRAGEGFRTKRVTRDQPDKWRTELSDLDVELLTAELERFPFKLLGEQ